MNLEELKAQNQKDLEDLLNGPVEKLKEAYLRRTEEIKTLYDRIDHIPYEIHEYMLRVRGIETECKTCGGWGTRNYGDTAQWTGRAGGQSITNGICDRCWGSGDEHRHWTNLRELSNRTKSQ